MHVIGNTFLFLQLILKLSKVLYIPTYIYDFNLYELYYICEIFCIIPIYYWDFTQKMRIHTYFGSFWNPIMRFFFFICAHQQIKFLVEFCSILIIFFLELHTVTVCNILAQFLWVIRSINWIALASLHK